MSAKRFKTVVASLTIALALCDVILLQTIGRAQLKQAAQTLETPKTWEAPAIASIEVPLANSRYSPTHISADYYYKIPARRVYKSYPVYAPGKEPADYLQWLKQQEPSVVFDPAQLKSELDWINAGELVFEAPTAFDFIATIPLVRDEAWYKKTGTPVSREGIMPFARYVVRRKGQVELGTLSCAMCHTRVLPDGSIVKGAQGNFPFDRAVGYGIRAGLAGSTKQVQETARTAFDTPWLNPNPNARLAQMSLDDIASAHEAIPSGVIARNRASLLYPVQVPDLIGVRERRYLDRTGINLHRNVGDMMRYAALNQGGDDLATFGDWTPLAAVYPDPAELDRYSDDQLFALTLYLYALKPPPNPNRYDELAARGRKVFMQSGCETCHSPPLYTNNSLVPAPGFKVPSSHLQKFDIYPVGVGTDPGLTLSTRRGTGYYKIPSLLGVWYRGPFEHSGSVLSLEDWFDPGRLKDDYVPTGFRGLDGRTRAVPGHPFGLDLSEEDRKALIAFLRTL